MLKDMFTRQQICAKFYYPANCQKAQYMLMLREISASQLRYYMSEIWGHLGSHSHEEIIAGPSYIVPSQSLKMLQDSSIHIGVPFVHLYAHNILRLEEP